MMNAYQALGLPANADEATIRARYLELVREFPPDRAPERFAEIRRSFDELRDPTTRIRQMVLRFQTDDSLEQMVSDLKKRMRNARIPTATLLSLGERT